MYTKRFLLFLATTLLYSIAFAQTDTVFWENDLIYAAKNESNRPSANSLHLNKSIASIDNKESSALVTIFSLSDSSWFSPQITDTAEQKLFFLIFSKAELWKRKQNMWLFENSELPSDYRIATIDDSWEKLNLELRELQSKYEDGKLNEGIDSEIIETLFAIYEYEDESSDPTPSAFGYGMNFFASTAQINNDHFDTPIGMGVGLQFFFRKTGINLQGNFLYGSVKNGFQYENKTWYKDQAVQHGQYSIELQHRVIDNRFINISPFVGFGLFESILTDTLANSNLSYKKLNRMKTYAPTVGINADFKLQSKSDGLLRDNKISYWLIRFGLNYTPVRYPNTEETNFWGFQLGLGGYSKFISD